jgi:hypothetical protein
MDEGGEVDDGVAFESDDAGGGGEDDAGGGGEDDAGGGEDDGEGGGREEGDGGEDGGDGEALELELDVAEAGPTGAGTPSRRARAATPRTGSAPAAPNRPCGSTQPPRPCTGRCMCTCDAPSSRTLAGRRAAGEAAEHLAAERAREDGRWKQPRALKSF